MFDYKTALNQNEHAHNNLLYNKSTAMATETCALFYGLLIAGFQFINPQSLSYSLL